MSKMFLKIVSFINLLLGWYSTNSYSLNYFHQKFKLTLFLIVDFNRARIIVKQDNNMIVILNDAFFRNNALGVLNLFDD